METEKTTLKTIRRVLALDRNPSLEDHLFDDLNTHHDEIEKLRESLNDEFDIELEESMFSTAETVKEVVDLVKDCTNDIS